jgi:hypothetical protein
MDLRDVAPASVDLTGAPGAAVSPACDNGARRHLAHRRQPMQRPAVESRVPAVVVRSPRRPVLTLPTPRFHHPEGERLRVGPSPPSGEVRASRAGAAKVRGRRLGPVPFATSSPA